jgi:penicillin-binding protein 2
MANEMKTDGFYIFDQPLEGSIKGEEKPNLGKRLRQFLKSRYAVLSLIFLLAGSLIFYNTAILQLSSSDISTVAETTGVSRQLTVKAARGDIGDATGLPLAYSIPVNNLLLTYAGLDNEKLNEMLLDLSLFLEKNNIDVIENLSDYLVLDHTACTHEEGAGADCGVPVFTREEIEIVDWQANRNIFGLEKLSPGQSAGFADRKVKTDPRLFFDYLLYTRYEIENPEADGLRYSREDAFRIMKLRYMIMINWWTFQNGTPIVIATGVSDEIISRINEQNYRFMGVISSREYERAYTSDARTLSHVLGYVGRITSAQYENLRLQGYAADAIIGQAGVEYSAERYLAGQNGIKPYNIWSVAGEEGAFYSESIGKDATPGYNVRLTLDLRLQSVAVASLRRVIEEIRNSPDNKNKGDADAGAVVMLDVRTGEILALASYPDYDPKDFIDQKTVPAAAERVAAYLTDNTNKPLWNRAIQEIYAPGSTFKPATAIAGLQFGSITVSRNTIRCKGREVIGEWPWRCLEYPNTGHGNLTLAEALATSCNMYFLNLGFKTGINEISYWGSKMGLGEITGIDLPGESRGIRASRENKRILFSDPGDQIWFPADTCQAAIGQSINSFTIIQLAVYTAALATGNRVTPHVISQITRNDGTVVRSFAAAPEPVGIHETNLLAVRRGMVRSVTDPQGTAYKTLHDFPIKVAAKTGTAETGFEDRSSSNGLFICYAPADNPQVAIAQVVEKGARGSNTILIARDLLTAYFQPDQAPDSDTVLFPGLVDGLQDDLMENTP